jgi:hypothetical protein
MVFRLLNDGADTTRFYPAHAKTPSDWAEPRSHEPSDGPWHLPYTLFTVYRLTGLMLSPDVPPLEVERSMLGEAEETGLSPAALQERGNRLVQTGEWEEARHAFSLSLVLSLQRLGSAAGKMEAAKAASNRSFAHLKMAKEALLADPLAAATFQQNARLMERITVAKARGPGGTSEALATPPDMVRRLRGVTMEEAVAAGRLEPWRMWAVLALADGAHAETLAPQWTKPLARQAEVAHFLATQSAREGDDHGLQVLSNLAIGFLGQAMGRETAVAAKQQYAQVFTHMKVTLLPKEPIHILCGNTVQLLHCP